MHYFFDILAAFSGQGGEPCTLLHKVSPQGGKVVFGPPSLNHPPVPSMFKRETGKMISSPKLTSVSDFHFLPVDLAGKRSEDCRSLSAYYIRAQ